ncbi:MAG TPA: hypothetical protein VEP69_00270, partial [Thermodesulfovibrionales bacterium]|nr:hypothetical protein [Thermodesulfovibrionales bacterium]
MRMRRTVVSTIPAILVCAMALAAYAQDKTPGSGKEATSSDIRRETSGAEGATGQRLNQGKESYQKKAEEKLRRMDEKIRALAAEAEKKGEKIKKEAVEKA